jgi:hypothetical protein
MNKWRTQFVFITAMITMQFSLTLLFRLKYEGLLHVTNYGTSFQWKLSDNKQNYNCNDKEKGQVNNSFLQHAVVWTPYMWTYTIEHPHTCLSLRFCLILCSVSMIEVNNLNVTQFLLSRFSSVSSSKPLAPKKKKNYTFNINLIRYFHHVLGYIHILYTCSYFVYI